MEDIERELIKLRNELASREENVHDLVEKLRSKKVDYNDLESILRDKNQEIDYLRKRLDESRNTENRVRRQAKKQADEVLRAERLGRLGTSPMSPVKTPSYDDGDYQTGLSPKDNFLKAIKDVLGIESPTSPQAVVRG